MKRTDDRTSTRSHDEFFMIEIESPELQVLRVGQKEKEHESREIHRMKEEGPMSKVTSTRSD